MNIHQHAAADGSFAPPPLNIEAEQCLLGAIFMNNEAFARVNSLVAAHDFFEPIHQEIFAICKGLIEAGRIRQPCHNKDLLADGSLCWKSHDLTVSRPPRC